MGPDLVVWVISDPCVLGLPGSVFDHCTDLGTQEHELRQARRVGPSFIMRSRGAPLQTLYQQLLSKGMKAPSARLGYPARRFAEIVGRARPLLSAFRR
jgi:hypothetical protein